MKFKEFRIYYDFKIFVILIYIFLNIIEYFWKLLIKSIFLYVHPIYTLPGKRPW